MMTRKENLSLDEFATAPRKPAAITDAASPADRSESDGADSTSPEPQEKDVLRQEAKRALRRVKRERLKGESQFVNVSLDRQTKRRLKLASFNAETSMQAILEKAIVKYLDDNGF